MNSDEPSYPEPEAERQPGSAQEDFGARSQTGWSPAEREKVKDSKRLLFWGFVGCGVLIALGIGAAVLTFVGHQRKLMDDITQLGGSYQVKSMRLRGMPDRINPGVLVDFVAIDLDGCSVDDEWVKRIAGETEMISLDFDGTAIGDAGVAHLSEMTQLVVLGLEDTSVTDAALPHLEKMERLVLLDLTNASVTDAGLQHLQSLSRIEYLGLDGTLITDDGVRSLSALPSLAVLDLERTELTDQAVAELAKLESLQELYLAGTQITADGQAQLEERLPSAKVFRQPVDRTQLGGRFLMR